jgi:sporulation protein YlmC with PRC-barrel domain
MHRKLSQLPRRTVIDATGRLVGRVTATLVDMETWVVDTLRVRLTRQAAADLELPWRFWRRPTVDVPTGLINAAADAIILRVSLAELHDAPPERVVELRAAAH